MITLVVNNEVKVKVVQMEWREAMLKKERETKLALIKEAKNIRTDLALQDLKVI